MIGARLPRSSLVVAISNIYFTNLGLVLVLGQLVHSGHQPVELEAHDNVAHDYLCCRAFLTNLVLIEDHACRFHYRYLMTSLTSLTLLPSEWLHATRMADAESQSPVTTHHRSHWSWRAYDKFRANLGDLKSHSWVIHWLLDLPKATAISTCSWI